MTKQDLINIAHEAQCDAGSLVKFNEQVTKYMYADFTHRADPVAAFLGALIAINDDADKALKDIEFYFSELKRVKEALLQAAN